MIYEFENVETGEIVERDFPMAEVPQEFEESGVKYRRHWAFSKSVHIPFQWGDGNNRPKYDKSPSGRKRFF